MLKLDNISAGYNGVPVVKSITFALAAREKLAVIGPNGCGKTTLLRAIAGVIPSDGEILIDGVPLTRMRRKAVARKIAMLSQITQIHFNYSVYETVMMGRYAHRQLLSAPGPDDIAAVTDALDAVHMYDHRHRAITMLSGGQLQRVFLARILAQKPEIILLDEPTNHLDMRHQLELLDYLDAWADTTQGSVVGVLHDINHAFAFADSVLLLKDGITVFYGPTDKLNAGTLKTTFDMDVAGYMHKSLQKWESII